MIKTPGVEMEIGKEKGDDEQPLAFILSFCRVSCKVNSKAYDTLSIY